MSHVHEAMAIEAFRDALARHLGLWFDGPRLEWLAVALERRLAATGQDRATYLAGFADDAVRRREVSALAPELTVGETSFFRYPAQFRALAEVVLPARMAAHAADRRLRLLSAGSATGEEAYSIAITARDVVPASWDVTITGVDLNAASVERASRGRYSDWALRDTPGPIRSRWFTGTGRDHQLDAAVRAAVRFEVGNLVEDDPAVWAPERYDVVFLRNVLIYFTRDQMRAVVARAARALQPGGFLFLGHAETLRELSTAFALRHTDDAFYYQRLEDAGVTVHDAAPWPRAIASDARRLAASLLAPPIDASDRAGAVERSAERIARPQRLPAPAADAAAAPGIGSADAAHARRLLGEERYAELDALLQAAAGGAPTDPALLLVAAAADTHRGRIAEAEAACGRLLALDPLNADAYGLLALCRDAAGDALTAEQHDQAALYLEPDRAMPHLHLGLLARRRGDRVRARRLFERALDLLPREDEERLRVAGGGIGRDGLLAVCRSELARLRRPA